MPDGWEYVDITSFEVAGTGPLDVAAAHAVQVHGGEFREVQLAEGDRVADPLLDLSAEELARFERVGVVTDYRDGGADGAPAAGGEVGVVLAEPYEDEPVRWFVEPHDRWTGAGDA